MKIAKIELKSEKIEDCILLIFFCTMQKHLISI